MDLAFDPFDENAIASSSEDCTVMIWNIPDGGLTSDMNSPVQVSNVHVLWCVKLL